jgi:hypothetical protein
MANTVPPKTSATITHTAIAGMADTLLDFSKTNKVVYSRGDVK